MHSCICVYCMCIGLPFFSFFQIFAFSVCTALGMLAQHINYTLAIVYIFIMWSCKRLTLIQLAQLAFHLQCICLPSFLPEPGLGALLNSYHEGTLCKFHRQIDRQCVTVQHIFFKFFQL